MTSILGRGCLLQKNQVSEALINLLSYWSDHKDHVDPLELNKSFAGPQKTSSSKVPTDIAQYTKNDLEWIINKVL